MEKIAQLLAERALPDLRMGAETIDAWRIRRRELLTILAREEYGFSPAAPASVTGEILPKDEDAWEAMAGKAKIESIVLSFETPKGKFSFPIRLAVPVGEGRHPAFVYLSFEAPLPNSYCPAEEIIDRGYAVANLCYTDVTSDSPVWDGLAAMYPRDPKTGWGKIGMWAFAASRVLDYLATREDIDAARCAVAGHSRLGKTALWCGAQDERFSMVISNGSGCGGAALYRGKNGEQLDLLAEVRPHWFAGNYQNWRNREPDAPFDQHMRLALTAPRALYISCAQLDTPADPDSEYLSCCAAQEAWTLHRMPGFIAQDRLPMEGDVFANGNVGYHLRKGTHFLSRTDWKHFMDFRDRYHI